jgi:site-specific DNA-methyltransferase (adenine-specific)
MQIENQVILGACLEVLRRIPDATYDAVITDPPYGIGNREPLPEEIIHYLLGADLDTGGDFMGKDWEIPSVAVWREIHRVLKPGGYVVCFGSTRTWDLISMGARMVGLEKSPSIADNHPGLQWTQSQGMPRSYNITGNIEDPDKAKEWEGYGTGLKPTWEPILIFSKPIAERTIVANVLAYGTGGINIDATRVKHASRADFEDHKLQVEKVKAKGGIRGNSWKNSSDLSGANDVSPLGRWPTDTTFTHAPECRKLGLIGETDANVWACAPGCPVAALDQQSGAKKGQVGPVSKVFPQFQLEPVEVPFFYTGKASKKEVTLDGEIENDHPTKKPIALMRWLIRLVTRRGALILDPYCGSGSTLHAAYEERVRYTGIEKNPHNHEIATKRMAIVQEVVGARQNSQDTFDYLMSLPDDE